MARRSSTPWVRFIVLLALLAAAGWGIKHWFGPEGEGESTDDTVVADPVATQPVDETPGLQIQPPPPIDDGEPVAPQPQTQPAPVEPASPEQIAKMRDVYVRGCARQNAGKLVEARALLSEALASGALPAGDGQDCRTRLNAIAATLVFSREIHPDDTYAREYRVKTGETLSGIVRQEGLFVPHEGIQRINQIADARLIQPSQRLKLIQGPFDAIITRHNYTLDLYHHGMFVKSFRIGLGQNGSTPIGNWRVRDRVRRARWTPPPGSNGTHTLECGEEGYPLGNEGLWIALDGMDRANEMVSGFGIHGTNEPDSIGKQASLGCVRLGDDDIALLFDLLYPGKSTVEVRP